MKQSLISVQSVNKSFNENSKKLHVLQDVNLDVMPGEFLVLLGPSGSGKSTLLRIMSGLTTSTDGQVVKQDNLKESYIFQNFALFPWLNVYQNIGFGLKMNNVDTKAMHDKVMHEVKTMSLAGFEHSYPRELSGGMKQRVGIARALAVDPQVIFLDEPFSALDSFTANRLRSELLQIWQEHNLTIIMVTHLIEEALQLADRIAVMSSRPGKIIKVLPNKLPRPRNLRSKDFFEMYDKINSLIEL